jgi:hypothetical protein
MSSREGSLESDIDADLNKLQWEALKALGAPEPDHRHLNRPAVQKLVASKLASMRDGRPAITPMGRKIVVRGSPYLWDGFA